MESLKSKRVNVNIKRIGIAMLLTVSFLAVKDNKFFASNDLNLSKPNVNFTIKERAYDIPVKAFVIKDKDSGEILVAQNEDVPLAPASLTKVMTALLAIESGKMQEVVTIDKYSTTVEPSKAGVKVGEQFLLSDLVTAALIASSNDAAMAVGIYLGGSVQGFAKMMNAKAKEIGMKNTQFTNPCGFDFGENLSTAKDLAILAEYTAKLPYFGDIVQQKKGSITALNTHKTYNFYTHNKMLKLYPQTIGTKTGYTQKAGPCLIARATNGDKDLIMVMLNAQRGQRWSIAKEQFDKQFGYLPQTIETPAQETFVDDVTVVDR
jgi:D-alanyl-D-alanine carboxypeptidase (penicillin-binding protein 5/6)